MPKSNNLNYLIGPTFNKVNGLFLLSFEAEDDKTSFSKCYTPSVEKKRLPCINRWQKLF